MNTRTREDVIQDLRTPLNITQYSDQVASIIRTAKKLDVIAESLAILLAETRK